MDRFWSGFLDVSFGITTFLGFVIIMVCLFEEESYAEIMTDDYSWRFWGMCFGLLLMIPGGMRWW